MDYFYYTLNDDTLVKSQEFPLGVIPRTQQRDLRQAEAGIQSFQELMNDLDPGFRRGDDFLRVHQTCTFNFSRASFATWPTVIFSKFPFS